MARSLACRDGAEAARLKIASIFVIFAASVAGISAPVVLARQFQGKPAYDKAVLVIKCFAAGVILSTSLVHVLPDAFAALADCHVASSHPWRDFPFAGLVTLIGALAALLVDLTASAHAELHAQVGHGSSGAGEDLPPAASEMKYSSIVVDEVRLVEAGAARSCGGGESEMDGQDDEEAIVRMKQRLVSQVLEIGIIFHSVIIGVTMGMSQNKCTIRPLVAALAFHQIFEGMGLGGCIAQVIPSISHPSLFILYLPRFLDYFSSMKSLNGELTPHTLSGKKKIR